MTNRNDENNWIVPAIGDIEDTIIVIRDQAENVARIAAENFANDNPGVTVCVYERKGTVKTVPTAKWE